MLGVLRAIGLRMESRVKDDVVRFDIELRPTSEYRATCDEREAVAEAASMAASCVSRHRRRGGGTSSGQSGHEVVRSLLAGDVAGTVYP